jgi:cysteine/O-acetylserine efflux protein
MTPDLLSLISYVLISTFTPGPSNISSASVAVNYGYKKTINFQIGLAAGVFALMVLSGWFSTFLLDIFPRLEPVLRYAGAAYILYLAFGILKAGYFFSEENTNPMGLTNGFFLQILNPKLMIYSFTLFTTFLAATNMNPLGLVVTSTLLAVTSFCATSTWALFGTAIQTHLRNHRIKMVINVILSLALTYAALSLLGIL